MVESWKLKADGAELQAQTWKVPEGTEFKAKVIFVHGFGGRMGILSDEFEEFAAKGYEVDAFDQRGQGTSVVKPDLTGVSNEYYTFKDLDQFVGEVVTNYDGLVYLMGVSMGGGIVLNYGVKGKHRERIDGYIALAPLVEAGSGQRPPKLIEAGLRALVKVAPQHKHTFPVNFAYLTTRKDKSDLLRSDPLLYRRATLQFIDDMLDRGKRLNNSVFVAKFVDRPVVVLQGLADKIVSPEATAEFFRLLKVKDKTYFHYEGGLHELFWVEGANKEKLDDNLFGWLDAHSTELVSPYKDLFVATPKEAEPAPTAEPEDGETAEPEDAETAEPKDGETETPAELTPDKAVETTGAGGAGIAAGEAPVVASELKEALHQDKLTAGDLEADKKVLEDEAPDASATGGAGIAAADATVVAEELKSALHKEKITDEDLAADKKVLEDEAPVASATGGAGIAAADATVVADQLKSVFHKEKITDGDVAADNKVLDDEALDGSATGGAGIAAASVPTVIEEIKKAIH